MSFSDPPKLLLPPPPSTGIEFKQELEHTFDLILKRMASETGIPERMLRGEQKEKYENKQKNTNTNCHHP